MAKYLVTYANNKKDMVEAEDVQFSAEGAVLRDKDDEVVMLIPKGQYQSVKRMEGGGA